jgi:hypothetical protein
MQMVLLVLLIAGEIYHSASLSLVMHNYAGQQM